MALPLLTVIIPTLQRPTTLYWTLKTVVEQDYDNLRIIVSDNFSNDDTPEVVSRFNDKRISYINPGRKLSMSHHWEFALEHADKGFVTILGDDDGLLPGGLKRMAGIIADHPDIQAIGWRFGNFNWKGLPPYFMIPMSNYYRVVDAEKEIQQILSESIYRTIRFPSLYGGFISTDLIREIKKKHRNVFFHSRIPDFFCGALVAASVKKYVRAEFPVSINATSRFSTGYATINEKNEQSAFRDLQKQEDNIPFHKDLVFIRSNAIPIAEAMLQVHDLEPRFPRLDIVRVLKEVIGEASQSESEAKFGELIEGARKMAAMNGVSSQLEQDLKNAVHQPVQTRIISKFSPVSITLYIDTTDSGIDNVDDACRFAAAVIPNSLVQYSGGITRTYARAVAMSKYLFLKLFSDKRRYF